MSEKDKAYEIYEKFYCIDSFRDEIDGGTGHSDAKECAIIAVEEIIEEVRYFCDDNHHSDRMSYWLKVKEEIELL